MRFSGRWVAETSLKSARRSSAPPTLRNVPVSRSRSSFTCSASGMSPTSSTNSVPPAACSTRPNFRDTPPVQAPFSCPKSSLSNSVSGRPEQSMATNGPLALRLRSWIACAASSLPVPDSPSSKMATLDGAARAIASSMAVKRGDAPTKPCACASSRADDTSSMRSMNQAMSPRVVAHRRDVDALEGLAAVAEVTMDRRRAQAGLEALLDGTVFPDAVAGDFIAVRGAIARLADHAHARTARPICGVGCDDPIAAVAHDVRLRKRLEVRGQRGERTALRHLPVTANSVCLGDGDRS